MSISWWISHTSPSRICSLHPVYKFWLVGYSENNSATMKTAAEFFISSPKRRIFALLLVAADLIIIALFAWLISHG